MLDLRKCGLVVVDVQGKLARLMHERDILFKNIRILIQAAKILDIPILWCQQCPDALGPTVPEISELLSDVQPINKSSFSCCGDERFKGALQDLGGKQILLCGIEAHVCVYQTAMDLVGTGYEVSVIADAVSSRTSENKEVGIAAARAEGAKITSTEMALFELLRTAEHPKFKQIAKLVK
ncbi:MAG TPA: hydrolase [Sedimentisphaerales bacterium]|nr:hydrolase [Sedimentisphaerales bacterium]